jgi:hypothetical protein
MGSGLILDNGLGERLKDGGTTDGLMLRERKRVPLASSVCSGGRYYNRANTAAGPGSSA